MKHRKLYLILCALASVAAALAWVHVARTTPSVTVIAWAAAAAMALAGVTAGTTVAAITGEARREQVSITAAGPATWQPRIVSIDSLPKRDDAIYLGEGTPLNWEAAQAITDMASAHNPRRPEQWEQVIRTLLGRRRTEPIWLPTARIFEHVRIHGGTGTGKSRMLELMGVQLALKRKMAIACLDPKGDDRMVKQLYTVAALASKPWHFFSPQMPAMSIAYNPLMEFSEARDVADRIKPLLPSVGEGEPYAQTQWKVVLAIANGLVDLGITPSFWRLRYHAEQGGREALFMQLLSHHYPDGQWTSPRDAANTYKDLVSKYEQRKQIPTWFAPSETVAGLIEIILESQYYSKMITSLLPLLTKLADGSLRDLMSPEDDRPMLTWGAVERDHAIAYFYMSALTGIETSGGLGKAAFLDLLNHLGRKFSYHADRIPHTPMVLMADELGDLVIPEFISALNKGRQAGLAIVTACQTMSDVIAKLSMSRAEQIMTNTRTVIQFRAAEKDAKSLSERIGTAPVMQLNEQFSYEPALFSSGHMEKNDFSGRFTQRRDERWVNRVPPEFFSTLPTGVFIMIAGSEVYLGEEPLLEPPSRDYIGEMTERLKNRPPGDWSHTGTPVLRNVQVT